MDSKRFNYQHVETYTLTQPASDAACTSRVTFEDDGTLSVQVSEHGGRVILAAADAEKLSNNTHGKAWTL